MFELMGLGKRQRQTHPDGGDDRAKPTAALKTSRAHNCAHGTTVLTGGPCQFPYVLPAPEDKSNSAFIYKRVSC